MRYLIFVLFCCIHFQASSQIVQGKVVDSLTKEPVSYANVTLVNKNRGVSADKDGQFRFDLMGEEDALLFSSVGYENTQLKFSTMADTDNVTVRLRQKAINLDAVVIDHKKLKFSGVKKLGLPKKAKVRTSLPFGYEIAAPIANTHNKPGKLKSVILDLQKEDDADYIASYNLRFYEYDAALKQPGEELYSEKVMVYPENKTYNLRIDVDSLNIPFPRGGICIGVEVINTKHPGEVKMMAKIGPRINFTHTSQKILSWSRFRNKLWSVTTHKSQVREDYVNAMIGIEVVLEK